MDGDGVTLEHPQSFFARMLVFWEMESLLGVWENTGESVCAFTKRTCLLEINRYCSDMDAHTYA